MTKLDFSIFSESLLEQNHIFTLFNSAFMLCFRVSISLCLWNTLASSANR